MNLFQVLNLVIVAQTLTLGFVKGAEVEAKCLAVETCLNKCSNTKLPDALPSLSKEEAEVLTLAVLASAPSAHLRRGERVAFPRCFVCTSLIGTLEKMINDSTNSDQIVDFFAKECQLLPDWAQGVCATVTKPLLQTVLELVKAGTAITVEVICFEYLEYCAANRRGGTQSLSKYKFVD